MKTDIDTVVVPAKLIEDYKELQSENADLKASVIALIRFAFEVRNSTNLNQEGRQKVMKINSIIERAEKLLK